MYFLEAHQLNIMLAFSGVCATMIIMLIFTKALSKERRLILIVMEISAFLLIIFERYAYVYSENVSKTGYVMVRLSNFVVFFLTSEIVLIFDIYLVALINEAGQISVLPRRVNVVGVLAVLGMIMSVVSQFTGLYYTFDENNKYHRGPGFIISYLIPFSACIILLTVIYKYRQMFGKWIYKSLVLFVVAPLIAALIQMFAYGLSLTNMTLVVVAMFMYVFAYLDINESLEKAHKIEIEYLQDEKKTIRRLFDQTVNAFVNAMDARYVHTQGHSARVAEYAKKIAELSEMSEDEIEEVYYGALLHDIGRIWMPDSIVRNLGELTDEENEKVRQMPIIGSQILSSIEDMPNLDVGAHYHCERYDGKGYPEGLSGDEIPEAAKIIAAADAYDLMATSSDLTPPMPPQLIRERFVRDSGQQFDPKYAKIIMTVMDQKETGISMAAAHLTDTVWENEFYSSDYREHVTSGIMVSDEHTKIHFSSSPYNTDENGFYTPSLVLFDSYDRRVHDKADEISVFRYTEFGEIWFDGHYVCTAARNMVMDIEEKPQPDDEGAQTDYPEIYEITAFRIKDHVRIEIENNRRSVRVTVALPDSSLYSFIGLTGEHCHITDLAIERLEKRASEEDIERIAEPISYVNRLESDIPNVQIDGWRTSHSVGIPVKDKLRIDFHTISLPSANLIWHCPYVVLFSSDDKQVGGENYREYAMIRFNGETNKTEEISENFITVEKSDEFVSWDSWKEKNKKGFECEINFTRNGNRITMTTLNAGIYIENTTSIIDQNPDIYVALTGDQCAITDIRIR